jgi:hypothetical protein
MHARPAAAQAPTTAEQTVSAKTRRSERQDPWGAWPVPPEDIRRKWPCWILVHTRTMHEEDKMGRGILLWMLGVPIPIIILLALLWR